MRLLPTPTDVAWGEGSYALSNPLPRMPQPGQAWDRPPAPCAARIAAMAAQGGRLPSGAPSWAVWLSEAVVDAGSAQ